MSDDNCSEASQEQKRISGLIPRRTTSLTSRVSQDGNYSKGWEIQNQRNVIQTQLKQRNSFLPVIEEARGSSKLMTDAKDQYKDGNHRLNLS